MKLPVLFAAAVALVSSSAASAAVYVFSYIDDPIQLTGRISGTLQPDGNTFFVNSLSGVFLNGEDKGPHPIVRTAFEPELRPVVTLDGSRMDFVGCDGLGPEQCSSGFIFYTVEVEGLGGSSSLFGFLYPPMPVSAQLEFKPSSWSMRLVGDAVPEPDSWALLIAGFGLTGAALRRRRALQPALVRIRR
jgi:hypothetical protein